MADAAEVSSLSSQFKSGRVESRQDKDRSRPELPRLGDFNWSPEFSIGHICLRWRRLGHRRRYGRCGRRCASSTLPRRGTMSRLPRSAGLSSRLENGNRELSMVLLFLLVHASVRIRSAPAEMPQLFLRGRPLLRRLRGPLLFAHPLKVSAHDSQRGLLRTRARGFACRTSEISVCRAK